MLIVMDSKATKKMVENVCKEIETMGLKSHPMPGATRTAIGVTGNKAQIDSDKLLSQPGVTNIIHVTQPYKLAGREFQQEDTIVDVDGIKIGGKEIVICAGPCSVESRDQAMIIAEKVAKSGAKIFRAGAYKPRTSPYSFQGLKEEGLKILSEVRTKFDLKIVTEAVDTEVIGLVSEVADIIQIGARNMQNYSLLIKAGQQSKPILLKRGMAATLEEFLMAEEHVLSVIFPKRHGERISLLCEFYKITRVAINRFNFFVT